MSEPSTVQPPVFLDRPQPGSAAGAGLPWLPLVTFTGWTAFLLVGLLGMLLPYRRPSPPPKEAAALPPIEMIDVELMPEEEKAPLPPPSNDIDSAEPPPLLDPSVPPEAPPLAEVAQLSEAVAFPLPIEGPHRIVDPDRASFRRSADEAAVTPAVAPPLETLTFGKGAGHQPQPRYPRKAQREGQEGTVVIRLSVGEDGRVQAAEIASASAWPLLNDAALRVVRERWRFAPGAARRYEVPITFKIPR